MIVAKLESSKDLTDVAEKLRGLEYEVVPAVKKEIFVFRKKGSNTDLSRDVKSAKDACKFTGPIKSVYGTNSATY
ncbi:hypothetical protein [Vreelandella sp. GE22]